MITLALTSTLTTSLSPMRLQMSFFFSKESFSIFSATKFRAMEAEREARQRRNQTVDVVIPLMLIRLAARNFLLILDLVAFPIFGSSQRRNNKFIIIHTVGLDSGSQAVCIVV